MSPNFAQLDLSQPEVAILVGAMVQARDAVERRSWSHPQEPTYEEWWADVLADQRARARCLTPAQRLAVCWALLEEVEKIGARWN